MADSNIKYNAKKRLVALWLNKQDSV
jgi:hypothetical protein